MYVCVHILCWFRACAGVDIQFLAGGLQRYCGGLHYEFPKGYSSCENPPIEARTQGLGVIVWFQVQVEDVPLYIPL